MGLSSQRPAWLTIPQNPDAVEQLKITTLPQIRVAAACCGRQGLVRAPGRGALRGPGGIGSATTPVTGFIKDYPYDQRLRFISPPFFIDPVEGRYVVRGWAEVRDTVGHPDGLPDFPDG